jgi:hypothetical protein
MRSDSILLTHALLRFQDGDVMVAGVAFHPSPVFQGALGQRLRGDRILTVHVAEEMYDMFGAGQQRQIPLDDDAVKTVIYKHQEAFEKFREGFHRSSPHRLSCVDNKIICQATDGIKTQDRACRSLLRSLRLCVLARN